MTERGTFNHQLDRVNMPSEGSRDLDLPDWAYRAAEAAPPFTTEQSDGLRAVLASSRARRVAEVSSPEPHRRPAAA